jgi:acyl dehydratase
MSKTKIVALLSKAITKSLKANSEYNIKSLSLPTNDYCLESHVVGLPELHKFHQVVQWPNEKSDILHPCYPQVLAFPLHMQLLLQDDFPFSLFGLVHLANEIEQSRPIESNECISVRAFLGDIKEHRQGLSFELKTEVRAGNKLVWRASSSNLFRQKTMQSPRSDVGPVLQNLQENSAELRKTEYWRLASSLGREYAKASGDFNPIHLHPLGAKILGFKRHIAHGMWSKSRSLSTQFEVLDEPFKCKVKFVKPLFLPNKVKFSYTTNNSKRFFDVNSEDGLACHLTGELFNQDM